MDDYEKALEEWMIKINEFKKTDTYKKAMEAVNAIDWKQKAEEYHKLVAEGKLKIKR